MRTYPCWIAILSMLAGVLTTSCEDDTTTATNTYFSAEAPFSFNVTRQARMDLGIAAFNGTIKITGSAVNVVTVSGVKRVESHTPDDAALHLEQLEVVLDSTDAAVMVRTEQPAASNGRNYIVNYTILVPMQFSANVTAANGDITVEPLAGDVSIQCANGRLTGKSIDGNVTMSLANGEIDVSVAMPPAGVIDLSTANGEITLRIPLDTSAEFSATVSNGQIDIEDLTLSDVTQTPTSITGTLGAGDGRITLGTANGAIWVQGF